MKQFYWLASQIIQVHGAGDTNQATFSLAMLVFPSFSEA